MSDDQKALEQQLDAVKKTVKTDAYPMSIGELQSMYERGELILKPAYQRFLRWDLGQKTKLIESILIDLPLPSFFVASDDDGNWEVVDGMQRISTIFEFMGKLKGEGGGDKDPLVLSTDRDDLIYLPKFCGKCWTDLSVRMQRDFWRTKVQLTILLRSEKLESKFELFQRLNSGGTKITGQELRNAMMAESMPRMLEWVTNLSDDLNFQKAIGLAENKMSERFDMELVLRFIVCLSSYIDNIKSCDSVDLFLTSVLRKMIEDHNFDYDGFESKFRKTFECIAKAKGDKALCFRQRSGVGPFSIAAFEAIALGIAQNLDNLPKDEVVLKKIDDLGNQEEYKKATSRSGSYTRSRLPMLLSFGKDYFSA